LISKIGAIKQKFLLDPQVVLLLQSILN